MAARRKSVASLASVIGFFSAASPEALNVVEYFKTTTPDEAAAALAVASAIVGDRQGSGSDPKPRRTYTRRAKAGGERVVGADAPEQAQPVNQTVQAGPGRMPGATRVVEGAATTSGTRVVEGVAAAPRGRGKGQQAQGGSRVVGGEGSGSTSE
jgi:hypothetical protein